jgi:hypothetical protein
MLGLAPQLRAAVAGLERLGTAQPIMVLRDRLRSSLRATYAPVSVADVARCRVDADVCNAMIG